MDPLPPPDFRSGIVALLGRTNVGKSTLLNALVNAKVSIVTPRPQTTRHAIQGVVHRPEGQIVFVDTPGFFRTRRNSLVEQLHTRARTALEGIDAVVHVVDPSRPHGAEDDMVLQTLHHVSTPRVLCLNKSDLPRRPHRAAWLARKASYAAIIEVSAVASGGATALVDVVLPLLPRGPALYPSGEVTNAGHDFRVAEVIREKIYLLTNEEVPYRTAVRIEEISSVVASGARPRECISATILVAEDRYKSMLIGAGGRMIREIRVRSRADLERLLGHRVTLEISVKVENTPAGEM